MSTLKVNTIQNTSAAHGSTPEQIAQGRAKAWLNLCGGVAGLGQSFALRDSFNISSVTDTATGRYTVNLTTAMSNTNYCVVSSGHYDSAQLQRVREVGARSLATSSYILEVSFDGQSAQDANHVYSAVFGDS